MPSIDDIQKYVEARRALVEADRAGAREFNKFGYKYTLTELEKRMTPEELSYARCFYCHPSNNFFDWDTSESGFVIHLVMCL